MYNSTLVFVSREIAHNNSYTYFTKLCGGRAFHKTPVKILGPLIQQTIFSVTGPVMNSAPQISL